jgi:putative FmdB family regulatory protein
VPTYEYACTECGERLEVAQSFSDAPRTVCPVCGGRLRKVFSPVGIVFKGSGFYRTDSRGKESKPAAAADGSAPAKADSAKDGAAAASGPADSAGKDKSGAGAAGKEKSGGSGKPSSATTGSKVA